MSDIDNIRIRIKKLIQSDDYTIAGVARAVDRSTSAISQFLAGKYTGDNEKLARAMEGYLLRYDDRAKMSTAGMFGFVETKNARLIHEICRMCHIEGEIGVIYGPAGLGKTIASKKYADDNPGVIYVEVDPSFSARSIIKEIHRSLGGEGKGGIYELFQDIVNRLKSTHRLVIVDQAEILPPKGIELIRAINDKAGVGIVMLGMETLRNNIKGLQGGYAQLYSRIGVSVKLKKLTDADIEKLVKSALPESNGLWKDAAELTQNGRTLSKLIKRSVTIAHNNNRKPDPVVLAEAYKLLEV